MLKDCNISLQDSIMDDENFSESDYLKMYEDVRLAVENGFFTSGYEHYCKHGKMELRRTSRFDGESHSIRDYTKLVRDLIAAHPDNYDLAMARAIGSPTLKIFVNSGDKQYHILNRIGLKNDQTIYDLACGSGRTAMALKRHGWQGSYRGADIIQELVDYAQQKIPDFQFFVHRDFSIHALENSLDIIYSGSLFTHLHIEEIFLYARDCHRTLKKGGTFVFSFLTLNNQRHREIFKSRAIAIDNGIPNVHLDTFLDMGTISTIFIDMLDFKLVEFIDANDATATPTGCFGQALAIFRK